MKNQKKAIQNLQNSRDKSKITGANHTKFERKPKEYEYSSIIKKKKTLKRNFGFKTYGS